MTEPTPPTTPSTSIERRGPSGMAEPSQSPSQPTPASIQSMGYCPSEKVVWNITKRIRKKMGKPSHRFDSTLSIRCVARYVSSFVPVRKPASVSAPLMKPYFASMMAVSASVPVSSSTRAAAVSRAASSRLRSSGRCSLAIWWVTYCSTDVSFSSSLMAR